MSMTMEVTTCPVCSLEFSRKDNMLRHVRNKHSQRKEMKTFPTECSSQQQQHEYIPPPPSPPSPQRQHQHDLYKRLHLQQQQQDFYNFPHQQEEPSFQYQKQQDFLLPQLRDALPHQKYGSSQQQEPFYILPTSDPNMFHCSDGLRPDHFMPWVHPFTSLIAGPTGSGKSVFVKRFVADIIHMMCPFPDRIIWCYGEYQTLYGTVEGVEFEQGLPDVDSLDPHMRHLIIIDDLMTETDDRVASLFTKKSHHRNISVMYIVQNLFHYGKHHRTISLNSHYMVLFKNPRDASQIHSLARQIFPNNTKLLLDAYAAATAEPHGYLVIDMKQKTPERMRLRSHIFPGEVQRAYVDG